MKKWWIIGLAVFGLGGAAAMATPSYTAVFLPTSGLISTYAKGIASNGQIVGYSLNSEVGLIWANSYSSPTLLNTPGYVSTLTNATDGTYQAGEGSTGTSGDAMLWEGSAQSAVDLNPEGYSLTVIYGIGGGQEVGIGNQGSPHAMLWVGSASSALDLNPSGYQQSWAEGTNGTQEVGFGTTTINGQPSGYQALLWSGTAASAQNITPAGYSDAQAWAISGNVVTGWADGDAALWDISNGSFTDLGSGTAYAIAGNYEVGYRTVGPNHAMLWEGSAASAIDLNNYLPPGYSSIAYGVDANGDVVGVASNSNGYYAVEWIAPEPAAFTIGALGLVLLGRRYRLQSVQ